MRDTQQFYEAYWSWRRAHDRLNVRVPERMRAALRLLDMDQSNMRRVLDVGCGEGTLGRLLRSRRDGAAEPSMELIGTDIAATALELAAEQYNHVYQINVEQERIRDYVGAQPFDTIVALEVLEHLFAPQAALEQIRELLAPGGRIIVSFPNIAWWRYRLALLAGRFPEEHHIFDAVEHLQHFTLSSFQRLLAQSGYRISAIDGEFLQPVGIRQLPSSIRQLLNRRFPNLFGYQVVIRAVPC
jgi:methionine biosynthesis protein MetW